MELNFRPRVEWNPKLLAQQPARRAARHILDFVSQACAIINLAASWYRLHFSFDVNEIKNSTVFRILFTRNDDFVQGKFNSSRMF